MWLIRQTREQQGRGIIGSMEPKGNMDSIGNMDNTGTMNNIGIRSNIGTDKGKDTLGQMGPRYKIVLLNSIDDEKMMRQHCGGKYRADGQVLKSVGADYKKKRGSGTGSKMDGRIRILKREKDLRLKRKVDGRIRILKRETDLRLKRKVDGRIRILRREILN